MASDLELPEIARHHLRCPAFAKAVVEATDNKFQIQVFAAGEIVPGLAAADAIQTGTVEMCGTASYYFGKDPTFVPAARCRSAQRPQMNARWYFGGGAELMNEFTRSSTSLHFRLATRRSDGYWFRKEISDVADLNGLKMRSAVLPAPCSPSSASCPNRSPAATSIRRWKRAPSTPEWSRSYDDEKLGFNMWRPTTTPLVEGGPMLHNFVNLDKWNGLPPAYKSLIQTASSMANEWMMAKYDADNPAALKRLRRRRCCSRSRRRSWTPA